jgi:hypothetical protein
MRMQDFLRPADTRGTGRSEFIWPSCSMFALLKQGMVEYVGVAGSGAYMELRLAAAQGVAFAREHLLIIVAILVVLFLLLRRTDKMRG